MPFDHRFALMIGTRPEAVKVAGVIRALKERGIDPLVFVTGQHRELLLPFLQEFSIEPAENLDIMVPDQSLGELSAKILTGMQEILRKYSPGILLVQGDTTSVAMSALACFYGKIPCGHIEAGLRTGNRQNPFPEEMNRILTGRIADIHFSPTENARENLLREGVAAESIHVVGNTVVDTLFWARGHAAELPIKDARIGEALAKGKKLVLVTIHRRESFGGELIAICQGILKLAKTFEKQAHFAWPVHLNPHVQNAVRERFSNQPNVSLLEPQSYLPFVQIMAKSAFIITDSGGIQEEGATLGIPVLVVRRTCERNEAVEAGVSQLVGSGADAIFSAGKELLTNPGEYARRAKPTAVFGDGKAGERIVEILLRRFS